MGVRMQNESLNVAKLGSVRAVERALAALEELGRHPAGMIASELARILDLSTSTTHRLLVTLESRRFTKFERKASRWHVGPAAFMTGLAFINDEEPIAAALPILRELGIVSGERVNLGRVDGDKVILLLRFDPAAGFCSASSRSVVPAYCSSMGKAVLGATQAPKLPSVLRPLTPNTVRSPFELHRQLEQARECGFALDDEENTVGLRCVAAPIFNRSKVPVAAVSMAAPVERFPKHNINERGSMIAGAARRITSALGGAEPLRR